MTIIEEGKEQFRPYARLINILGDQLISDKWIAVIELVKNCYDADATEVSVRFNNMENLGKPNLEPDQLPSIEIEDNGIGMNKSIILNIWMKPATPHKLNRKRNSNLRFTPKNRIMQGDKGVGRFAVYKLGTEINLYSKTQNDDEVHLHLDFTDYASDEVDLSIENTKEDKFLDQILNVWKVKDKPEKIKNEKNQGTLIKISNIKNKWYKTDLEKLSKAFFKMVPPIIPGLERKMKLDFDISLFWDNDKYENSSLLTFEQIINIAPFKLEGSIDEIGNFSFIYNYRGVREITEEFNLFEISPKYNIKNLKLFKNQFLTKKRKPKVGPFDFFFFAYDLTNKEDLKTDEVAFIKENNVYLYRDAVRVYPYGEPGSDWLELSKYRAEDKAGYYYSYNDLIGFVLISQEKNPLLKDAADREGLMNIDETLDDFRGLIQAALFVMKCEADIDKGKTKLKKEKALLATEDSIKITFDSFRKDLSKVDDKSILQKADKFITQTQDYLSLMKEKVEITQDLSGLGMAVEKASHDVLSILTKLRVTTNDIQIKINNQGLAPGELKYFVANLADNVNFIYDELQILQPLFRVSRKAIKDISISDIINRVTKYFKRDLSGSIELEVNIDNDINVKTNVGLLLQVFINLMDNSIYWLNESSNNKNLIRITLQGNNVIFSDNGIGIPEEIKDLIFMEFFSRKPDGRGLGLYIVKELLERINADIHVLSQNSSYEILPGANFILTFNNN